MDEALEAFVKSDASSSEELHEFVLSYNWDKGVDAMIDVVRNPGCDKNTALLVFWLSGVSYYQGSIGSRDDIADWDLEKQSTWDLIHFIMDKVCSGGYVNALMSEEYLEEIYQAKKPLWKIPNLLTGVDGDEADNGVKINPYDAGFSAYGPHCFKCRKSIPSYHIPECPHCLKAFECDCIKCRDARGAV